MKLNPKLLHLQLLPHPHLLRLLRPAGTKSPNVRKNNNDFYRYSLHSLFGNFYSVYEGFNKLYLIWRFNFTPMLIFCNFFSCLKNTTDLKKVIRSNISKKLSHTFRRSIKKSMINSVFLRYWLFFDRQNYAWERGILIQCPPLNRINLGQRKSDNNNRMFQLTDVFCLLSRYNGTSIIWLQYAADSIIRDPIKRRALY